MNVSLPTSSTLLDIHSILESKIQYIEYQAHCNLHECVTSDSSHPKSNKTSANLLMQNFEWMLQQINKRTSDLKLLQIIKCWLREENLDKVMELLHNNTYKQHSEESLEKMLKKGALELMRLQFS